MIMYHCQKYIDKVPSTKHKSLWWIISHSSGNYFMKCVLHNFAHNLSSFSPRRLCVRRSRVDGERKLWLIPLEWPFDIVQADHPPLFPYSEPASGYGGVLNELFSLISGTQVISQSTRVPPLLPLRILATIYVSRAMSTYTYRPLSWVCG